MRVQLRGSRTPPLKFLDRTVVARGNPALRRWKGIFYPYPIRARVYRSFENHFLHKTSFECGFGHEIELTPFKVTTDCIIVPGISFSSITSVTIIIRPSSIFFNNARSIINAYARCLTLIPIKWVIQEWIKSPNHEDRKDNNDGCAYNGNGYDRYGDNIIKFLFLWTRGTAGYEKLEIQDRLLFSCEAGYV